MNRPMEFSCVSSVVTKDAEIRRLTSSLRNDNLQILARHDHGTVIGFAHTRDDSVQVGLQDDVAKIALQELRRAQPNISLAWIANQMPIRKDADREHYLEAFRRAGLA